MSYFDDASLVMIPSGYKNGKVYSVKPTDGSGDLTFTRASNATRVASNGLIEKVRTNLVLQSNSFNTTWVTTNTSVTGGQTGYDGSSDAWLLTKSAANAFIGNTVTFNGVFTQSIYAKAGTLNWIALQNSGISQTLAWFDLQNGQTGFAQSNVISHSITNVGGGWHRCEVTYNGPSGTFRVFPSVSDNNTSGTSGNILIQNAQFEAGDIATDYIATTTAAVSVGPVSGLPRLDYLNSSCPRLLLEPQRTNIAIYSEQFDNPAWAKTRTTTTPNSVISPDGYTNGDTITPNTTADSHLVSPATILNLGGVVGTMSVFAKYNGYHLSLSIAGNPSNWTGCVFDLENGIARTPQQSGTQSVCTSKIEDFGNGWYRCSITYTPYTSGAFYTNFGITSTNNATLTSYGVQYYAGNNTSGVYLFGAQVELGAYATSYIGPTLGTSVTRVADALRTASGATSLFNSTWTAFGELIIPAKGTSGTATGFGLRNTYGGANPTDFVYNTVHSSTANSLEFQWYVSGSIVKTVTVAITYGTPVKFAVTSDGILYVNGVQVSASSSLTPATPVEFAFGRLGQVDASNGEAESVAQALLFKSILTPAQLAELTA